MNLLVPGERGPVDQSTRPGLAPSFLSLAALRDEPLGELYRVDPGLPCRSRIIVCRWGSMEHQGRKLQQVLQLGKQTRLVDLVTLGPVFQSADDHRLVRQVEHRTRPECHDHLTLPDLTVGFLLLVLGGSSSLVLLLDLGIVHGSHPEIHARLNVAHGPIGSKILVS